MTPLRLERARPDRHPVPVGVYVLLALLVLCGVAGVAKLSQIADAARAAEAACMEVRR